MRYTASVNAGDPMDSPRDAAIHCAVVLYAWAVQEWGPLTVTARDEHGNETSEEVTLADCKAAGYGVECEEGGEE